MLSQHHLLVHSQSDSATMGNPKSDSAIIKHSQSDSANPSSSCNSNFFKSQKEDLTENKEKSIIQQATALLDIEKIQWMDNIAGIIITFMKNENYYQNFLQEFSKGKDYTPEINKFTEKKQDEIAEILENLRKNDALLQILEKKDKSTLSLEDNKTLKQLKAKMAKQDFLIQHNKESLTDYEKFMKTAPNGVIPDNVLLQKKSSAYISTSGRSVLGVVANLLVDAVPKDLEKETKQDKINSNAPSDAFKQSADYRLLLRYKFERFSALAEAYEYISTCISAAKKIHSDKKLLQLRIEHAANLDEDKTPTTNENDVQVCIGIVLNAIDSTMSVVYNLLNQYFQPVINAGPIVDFCNRLDLQLFHSFEIGRGNTNDLKVLINKNPDIFPDISPQKLLNQHGKLVATNSNSNSNLPQNNG